LGPPPWASGYRDQSRCQRPHHRHGQRPLVVQDRRHDEQQHDRNAEHEAHQRQGAPQAGEQQDERHEDRGEQQHRPAALEVV
jgi:hypothetical protein